MIPPPVVMHSSAPLDLRMKPWDQPMGWLASASTSCDCTSERLPPPVESNRELYITR